MKKKVEIFNNILNALVTKDNSTSFTTNEGRRNFNLLLSEALKYTDYVYEVLKGDDSKDNEIWCNDVVIVSINDLKMRYLITDHSREIYSGFMHEIQTEDGKEITNCEVIDAHSEFAKQILGKQVGDVTTVTDEVEREFEITILSHQRTNLSKPLDELLADEDYMNLHRKSGVSFKQTK